MQINISNNTKQKRIIHKYETKKGWTTRNNFINKYSCFKKEKTKLMAQKNHKKQIFTKH